jgi:hypothetical protein
MRNFYKLENKWKNGEVVDVSHLLIDNNAQAALDRSSQQGEAKKAVEEEIDPFWS